MSSSASWLPALWFLAVLALIPLALWLLKRTPLHAMHAGGGVRVVASTSLGPGQRLLTVEVGEGESRRWLLLGATAQQIHLISDIPPGETPAQAPAFAQLLQRARTPRP